MGNDFSDGTNQAKTAPPLQKKKDKILNKPSMSKPSFVTPNNSIEGFSNIGQDDKTVALTSYFSGNMHELDEKCNSMMEKTLKKTANSNPLYKCTTCGKEAISGDLKKHIEANHLEGISIPCNFCEKTFRSRSALATHIHRNHNKQKNY